MLAEYVTPARLDGSPLFSAWLNSFLLDWINHIFLHVLFTGLHILKKWPNEFYDSRLGVLRKA
jgi:hypothetical protein